MKINNLLIFLTICQTATGMEKTDSLDLIIENNGQAINIFNGNLCKIDWLDRLSIQVLKSFDSSINLTLAKASTLEELPNLSRLTNEKKLRFQHLKKSILISHYTLPASKKFVEKKHPSGNGQKRPLTKPNEEPKLTCERKNAILAFEYVSKTPLWWNLSSFEQLEELCAYYKDLFSEFEIDGSEKVPLLITIKNHRGRCFWAKNLANYSGQPTRSVSQKSWDFLKENFYIVQSDFQVYCFASERNLINQIIKISLQEAKMSLFERFFKSISFKDIQSLLFWLTIHQLYALCSKTIGLKNADTKN